jgi:hypothetical protein
MQAGLNGFHGINKYPIDRWISWDSDITLNDGYISVASPIDQRVSLDIVDVHKKYTVALCLSNDQIRCDCATFENTIGSYGMGVYCYYAPDGADYVTVRIASNTDVKWVALYEGEYTLETLPEYQPKGYGAELTECRRYYRPNEFLSCVQVSGQYFSVSKTIEMRVVPTATFISFAPYGNTNVSDFTNCALTIDETAPGVQLITYANLPTCTAHKAGGLVVNLSADL